MKITDTKVYTVDAGDVGREPVTWTYLRVDTDAGITGWGQAGACHRDAALVCRTGLEEIRELLVGEEAADIERIWHKIYRRFTYFASRGFARRSRLPSTLRSGRSRGKKPGNRSTTCSEADSATGFFSTTTPGLSAHKRPTNSPTARRKA